MTYAAVCASKSAWNSWGSSQTKTKIGDHSDYVQSEWNADVPDGSGNYEITVYDHYSNKPDLTHYGSPSDSWDAYQHAIDWIDDFTNLHDSYDSIIVLDDREFNDGIAGLGYVGSAGGRLGVAYVNGYGGKGTSLHEMTHNYGGDHHATDPSESTFDTTYSYNSVMGSPDEVTCEGESGVSNWSPWFSDCTENAARNHIDTENL